MDRPVISFLSDFGARDPSAAICRGVMLGIARDAQVVDITHEVAKWAVRDGAFLLWNALPYLPVGTHVAVVDPGVGTARRPIGLRCGRGDALVGPDNGLLVPAAERLGGIVEARVLENRELWLPATTATFQGRDIFAPVAAHLATGTPFKAVGPTLESEHLVRLPWPGATIEAGILRTAVLYIDSFGNVKLGAMTADLQAAIGQPSSGDLLVLELPSGPVEVPWAVTFGDVARGETLLYEDSYARVCVAVREGDVAAQLRLVEDQPIAVRRAG